MTTPSSSPVEQPVLALDHVSKSFGPVKVIDDVTVNLFNGRVTTLLGENGAGKSTLIKMMSGIYQPDGGRILIDGAPTVLPDVRAAESKGIATIHQELNLAPNMSVAENVLLGRAPSRFATVNFRALRRQAREALEQIGLSVDLDTPVGRLGVAHQQMVEIAKALSMRARILILDEPTAALTDNEIEQLFGVMRRLKESGVAMAFISHHLDEIPEIGDQVVVLRDGHQVADVEATCPQDELIRLMVGRNIDEQFPRRRPEPGPVLLEVKDLTSAGKFGGIGFSVRAGEVLGISGLVGAGRTEVMRAIFGVDRYDSGEVVVKGKRLAPHSVDAAIHAGLGLVPEDRKAQGLVLDAPVADNLGYATLISTGRAGLADRKGQRRRAGEVAEALRIRMTGLDQLARNLSGGNQQKIVFGRWVQAHSTILLMDEPTRGVDVGAKVEIYELINRVTDGGGAVVMVSSELPEILGMSDRILVMSGGRIAGELPAAEATQDAVMALAVSNAETNEMGLAEAATTNQESKQ